MRIVLTSVLTGLMCALWLYLALFPFTLTRFAIYGFLFLVSAFVGLGACDRIRHQQGMWGRR